MPKSEAQNSILPQLLEIPAPPPPNPLIRNSSDVRSPEFFSQENPPADDAPIEDLLAYWAAQNDLNEVYNPTIEPSDRVLNRILAEIEKDPEIINNYLNVLAKKPESADAVKQMYQRILNSDDESNKYRAEQLKSWLTYNSNYFSDELLQAAQQVQDTEEYVTNQDDLLALARVDWEKARPMLERMLNDSSQPVSQTLANWAFYLHALKEGNSIEAGNYRDFLMKTVEDKNAKPGNRDLAMDALVYGGDFPGRDDWYFSLLEDETLYDLRVGGQSYTGLTTLLMRTPTDKLINKMIELVGSSNPTVRNAAVRNLTTVLNKDNPEVIKALLPWLENPDWAKQVGQERMLVVSALAQIEMPESVPGLMAILNEKTTIEIENDEAYPNSNMMMNSNIMRIKPISYNDSEQKIPRVVYPYRDAAIDALIKQKSFQAAAALRQVLPEVQPWKRDDVVRAILLSGGFTIPEQVEALEITARQYNNQLNEAKKYQAMANSANSDGNWSGNVYSGNSMPLNSYGYNTRVGSFSGGETFNTADIKPMLGEQLVNIGEPGNELVSAVIFRLNNLEKSEPQIAGLIREFMQNWKGEAINALLLNDLAEGKSDLNAIVKLLSLRKEIREKQTRNILDVRSKGNPIALGVSACLLENENEYAGILANANDDAKIALLGCARLIRARISVQTVAPFVKNPNKTLALAAEKYIESEDSPAARQIIYSLHPNEAKILGATFFFGESLKSNVRIDFLSNLFGSVSGLSELPPYYFYSIINSKDNSSEEKLKKEVIEDEKLVGIYGYNKNYVRIYQDKAVFSWEEDEARYRERKLNDSEFNYLKSFLASSDAGNLPPFVSFCGGCQSKELVMLGRQGGRRVFNYTESQPQFFEDLEKIFEDMRKPPAKLRYWLEKDIAGLEILFADQDLQAKTVWKNGNDLRVLINNTNREEQIEKELNKLSEADQENENLDYEQSAELDRKRRSARAFESYSWHKFSGNKLGDFTNQPAGVNFITQGGSPRESEFDFSSAKAGNVEIKTIGDNLYKVVGGQTTKIQSGYYRSPVITANARWVVLTKYEETEDKFVISRINLQTNKELKVKLDGRYRFSRPLTFIPSANKVLIISGNIIDYENGSIKNGSYFLLDAETGAMQPTTGEFRPFNQQTFRELQKTANADEVWAAISDENKKETQIGTYNVKTYDFKSVLTVPQISFDSMDMWIDESANKVYVVYNGQLLSFPLKKETSEPEKVS
jgi:hypothetical protein